MKHDNHASQQPASGHLSRACGAWTPALRPGPSIVIDLPIVLTSGFPATLAMTTIIYVLPMLHMGQVDPPLWAARPFVEDPVLAAAVGLTIHLFVGFGYAWLLADQVEPRLSLVPTCQV